MTRSGIFFLIHKTISLSFWSSFRQTAIMGQDDRPMTAPIELRKKSFNIGCILGLMPLKMQTFFYILLVSFRLGNSVPHSLVLFLLCVYIVTTVEFLESSESHVNIYPIHDFPNTQKYLEKKILPSLHKNGKNNQLLKVMQTTRGYVCA